MSNRFLETIAENGFHYFPSLSQPQKIQLPRKFERQFKRIRIEIFVQFFLPLWHEKAPHCIVRVWSRKQRIEYRQVLQ
jgi:hypothetical protein